MFLVFDRITYRCLLKLLKLYKSFFFTVTTNETSVITEVIVTTEKTRVCFYLGKIIPEGRFYI